MNEKNPLTNIGILDLDTRKWYEAEQYWDCELEDLRKMQTRKDQPPKRQFIPIYRTK